MTGYFVGTAFKHTKSWGKAICSDRGKVTIKYEDDQNRTAHIKPKIVEKNFERSRCRLIAAFSFPRIQIMLPPVLKTLQRELGRSLILGFLLFFWAQSVPCQPNPTPDGKEQNAAQGQATPANSQDEARNGYGDRVKANPSTPKWYEVLRKPDWWVLLVAVVTGCVVGWQSWETRKAAQASLKQAMLLKRQTKIQEAGMRQWIDVQAKVGGVSAEYESGVGDVFVVQLEFEAVNNTPYVLTILKIRTSIGMEADIWEIFTVETSVDLSPKRDSDSSVYPFYLPAQTIGKERFERGTVVTINGEITFRDCLGKIRTDYFGGLYDCGRGGLFVKIKQLGIVPDRKKVYARNPTEST